jgi:hypothetical protein
MKLQIITLANRLECQLYKCLWCDSQFLYQGVTNPSDAFFVVSDDVPPFCPHCGMPASRAHYMGEKK